jgi:formylglycine-generating enzyme required for sulfatase activity
VSWDDVERFFSTLAATSDGRVDDHLTRTRAALPTEVQWEYAARAGSAGAYWWGNSPDNDKANWEVRQGPTTPVKHYPANPWGLFDLHGGVWEWCADPWRQRLDQQPQAEVDLSVRVMRGGSWFSLSACARSAARHGVRSRQRDLYNGFRMTLKSFHQGSGQARP